MSDKMQYAIDDVVQHIIELTVRGLALWSICGYAHGGDDRLHSYYVEINGTQIRVSRGELFIGDDWSTYTKSVSSEIREKLLDAILISMDADKTEKIMLGVEKIMALGLNNADDQPIL